MKSKSCSKCKIEKSFTEFYKGNDIYNLQYKCKTCIKKYYLEHKEKIMKRIYDWQQTHKERVKLSRKKYRNKHKNQNQQYKKLYRLINKDKLSKYDKEYRKTHQEQEIKRHALYRKTHKREERLYMKNRRKTNMSLRILDSLRARINKVLKGNTKATHTLKLLGCSVEFLKKHFEKQFKHGMSWSNYGRGWNCNGVQEWHIDHIKPCAKFDLSKPSEQRKCFHYTNLQPLWAKENLKKNCKLENTDD